MENSQSQSLFDLSNMSDLEIVLYIDSVFNILKDSCSNEDYLEGISSDDIQGILLSINESIEFFLETEQLDYLEDMINCKIKLEKIINNIK
jgi:hypothetical protein